MYHHSRKKAWKHSPVSTDAVTQAVDPVPCDTAL